MNCSKLCSVISGPTLAEAQRQLTLSVPYADLIELRTDLINLTETEWKELIQMNSLPFILTFRSKTKSLPFLYSLSPSYIDMEYDTSDIIWKEMKSRFPKAKIICSLHNFQSTPHLEDLFSKMKIQKADIYKIATTATSTLDALRMLEFLKSKKALGESLLGICMGYDGKITRILGPIYGNEITYAAPDVGSAVASGQIDLETLIKNYNIKQLSAQTTPFGLIGEKVDHSISHKTHNHVFQSNKKDAVYVKMALFKNELPVFFESTQRLGFGGLSVTMPLKEAVVPFITTDQDAVNTIIYDKTISGYNTDGIGALKALQEKVKIQKKRVVVLGAGGAARAIVASLAAQQADIVILNRSLEKAKRLANQYSAEIDLLTNFENIAATGYDVLINCTPVGMNHLPGSPIDTRYLLSDRIVMEIITVPKKTELVEASLAKNCTVVYGSEMFFYQAVEQFKLWCGIKNIERTSLWTSL